MANQVKNLAQEKVEFIVKVWSSDFPTLAPKSRNYLYDYIKTKHPDFVCGTDVLRDAQKILKANVERSKTNFDSIFSIQVLESKIHEFVMELRSQFISDAIKLRQSEVSGLAADINLLKSKVENQAIIIQQYEEQCRNMKLEIEQLTNALKECNASVDLSNTQERRAANRVLQEQQVSPVVEQSPNEALLGVTTVARAIDGAVTIADVSAGYGSYTVVEARAVDSKDAIAQASKGHGTYTITEAGV